MVELFQVGGVAFMSLLTILFIGVLVVTARYWIGPSVDQSDRDLIKSVGLLALITGILGQLRGLYSAFQAIEKVGSVSPAMLAGGLKVSMITTIYGLIIYIIALLLWLAIAKLKS